MEPEDVADDANDEDDEPRILDEDYALWIEEERGGFREIPAEPGPGGHVPAYDEDGQDPELYAGLEERAEVSEWSSQHPRWGEGDAAGG